MALKIYIFGLLAKTHLLLFEASPMAANFVMALKLSNLESFKALTLSNLDNLRNLTFSDPSKKILAP